MQRFKTGDRVLILPKFAQLYPGTSGVIISVIRDPFRPMFNEYTIQFPDGSKARLFEFQILEDPANYQFVIATLAFDSYKENGAPQLRGRPPDRQVILETPTIDIDMKIRRARQEALVLGQVCERSTTRLIEKAEVTLMKESTPIVRTATDAFGIFKFTSAPLGTLNIHVLIPAHLLHILGTLSI